MRTGLRHAEYRVGAIHMLSNEQLKQRIAALRKDAKEIQWMSAESAQSVLEVACALEELIALRSAAPETQLAPQERIGGFEWINWNELSTRGLLVRINREILHPIGLAAFRDPSTGASAGALISPDGKWEYRDDKPATDRDVNAGWSQPNPQGESSDDQQ